MPLQVHKDKKELHNASGKLRWQDAEGFNEQSVQMLEHKKKTKTF